MTGHLRRLAARAAERDRQRLSPRSNGDPFLAAFAAHRAADSTRLRSAARPNVAAPPAAPAVVETSRAAAVPAAGDNRRAADIAPPLGRPSQPPRQSEQPHSAGVVTVIPAPPPRAATVQPRSDDPSRAHHPDPTPQRANVMPPVPVVHRAEGRDRPTPTREREQPISPRSAAPQGAAPQPSRSRPDKSPNAEQDRPLPRAAGRRPGEPSPLPALPRPRPAPVQARLRSAAQPRPVVVTIRRVELVVAPPPQQVPPAPPPLATRRAPAAPAHADLLAAHRRHADRGWGG